MRICHFVGFCHEAAQINKLLQLLYFDDLVTEFLITVITIILPLEKLAALFRVFETSGVRKPNIQTCVKYS